MAGGGDIFLCHPINVLQFSVVISAYCCIWGTHTGVVEDSSLRCVRVSLGYCFQTFRFKVVPLYSGVKVSSPAHTNPATRRHTPGTLDLQVATSFIKTITGSCVKILRRLEANCWRWKLTIPQEACKHCNCRCAAKWPLCSRRDDARARHAGAFGDPTVIVVWSRQAICLELPLHEFFLEVKRCTLCS